MKDTLYIVSAPSGAGKTSIVNAVVASMPTLEQVVTATTRSPRDGEVNGRDYFFLSLDEFNAGISNDTFIEWANVHGNLYGTPVSSVDAVIANKKNPILVVDVQGAQFIRDRYKDNLISIFIDVPVGTLKNRLSTRGSDSEEVIAKRLDNARIEQREKCKFDYVVVNDDFDTAVNDFIGILSEH